MVTEENNLAKIDLDDTPVVTIDIDVMEENIRQVQAACDRFGVALRPHIKTHKNPELARRQLQAGAKGIACQTLGEVDVMQKAGIDDIMLTYNIIGQAKLNRLVQLAERSRLLTVTDNEVVAKGLSQAFQNTSKPLGVLVECDVGAGRLGVQTPKEAAELAAFIETQPGLTFAGLMTYPITSQTADFLQAAYDELASKGLRAEIVSTGGTPTLTDLEGLPGVTEHRAGTYIFNDRSLVEKGVATWETCAMRIRATVISRPTSTRAIIDAGSKTLSADTLGLDGYGHILEYPGARIYALNEEHGYVDLEDETARRPELGEVIHIVPNHTCVVTNLHDELVGVRSDRVEEVWKVAARGMVR